MTLLQKFHWCTMYALSLKAWSPSKIWTLTQTISPTKSSAVFRVSKLRVVTIGPCKDIRWLWTHTSHSMATLHGIQRIIRNPNHTFLPGQSFFIPCDHTILTMLVISHAKYKKPQKVRYVLVYFVCIRKSKKNLASEQWLTWCNNRFCVCPYVPDVTGRSWFEGVSSTSSAHRVMKVSEMRRCFH